MLSQELFIGITSFQFGFVLFQWYCFRRKEYVYYLLYILAIIIYFLLLYLSDENHYIHIVNNSWNILYIEKSISFLAYGFYVCFAQLFLNLPQLHPRLNRFVRLIEVIIFCYCIINPFSLLITSNFEVHAKIYSIVFTLVFIYSMFITSYFLFFQKKMLSRFLVIAGTWIFVGTFVSMVVGWHNNDPLLANPNHMLFLQLGVLMELFILNSCLVYKVKMIQDEVITSHQIAIKELKENKKLNERLNHIREEISMDLHDEVGSGFSTIRLLIELMKQKTFNGDYNKQLNKISKSSKELMQKMNEIVWALNVSNDNLESLIAYIHEYAMNFLDNTNINCFFQQPDKIPERQVAGNNRRAIFLIVKEALNNIVKHAQASEVNIWLKVNERLEITIQDNGKGLEKPADNVSHNGLQNMRHRASLLHGTIEFLNHEGTNVIFSIPVEGLSHESVI
jgi:signal transduction histidine kinase